jgi:2-polyprenyl-3-methyl-5-hydroxy-6-metoxy-1,4-benzoquinol methylase
MYASAGDDLSAPATSALLALVGHVDGQRVLDLACGHGPVARELARRGAHVVGLDLSSQLIDRARVLARGSTLDIDYWHGDATAPRVLDANRFDTVVCNFGLSDIDDLGGVCATVARTLVPGGRFVFSILHPCFAGGPAVSGSWPSTGTYYDEGFWRADGELSTLRQKVGANHRTLSTYVNTLIQHDLAIESTIEPEPEASWTTERPEAAAQPVYLVISCRRATRAPTDP